MRLGFSSAGSGRIHEPWADGSQETGRAPMPGSVQVESPLLQRPQVSQEVPAGGRGQGTEPPPPSSCARWNNHFPAGEAHAAWRGAPSGVLLPGSAWPPRAREAGLPPGGMWVAPSLVAQPWEEGKAHTAAQLSLPTCKMGSGTDPGGGCLWEEEGHVTVLGRRAAGRWEGELLRGWSRRGLAERLPSSGEQQAGLPALSPRGSAWPSA